MSVSCATLTLYAPSSQDKAESDPQVKKLEAQIKDWETCPTTDVQTKRKILGPLIDEVDSLKSSIDEASKSRLDVLV
jgi:hypothetical protein